MSTQSQPAKQAQQLTPFASALAGALGACFSNAVVYPLDVAKTRIQVTSSAARGKRKDDLNMLSLLLEIFKQEGINGWYRGFAATMLNTFSMRVSSITSSAFPHRAEYPKNMPTSSSTHSYVHHTSSA